MTLDLLSPKPAPKALRPHQLRALEMLREAAARGSRRPIIQMPTGAGKTLTAANILAGALNKGHRVIFTAPALSLIDQTVAAFEAEGVGPIGVMQGAHPRTDPSAPVQVASVQTLARREIPEAALVIVDECHIRSEVIDRLMDERRDVFFVGLSATPWREGMGRRWDELVVPCRIGDLIEQGFLSRFKVFAPSIPDLDKVKVRAGDYEERGLAEVMGEAKLMGNVVTTWLERGEDRPTLAFGVNRAHAEAMAGAFVRGGVAAAYVDGFTDAVQRRAIFRGFEAGEIRVISSVRTMTTGVDLRVSCIVDAAPTKSEMLHVQKIGRGLRVNRGTEDCVILDHAGNSLRLGLVTDIHHEDLDDTQPGLRRKARPGSERLPRPCPACAALHTGGICPACGHESKPSGKVETVEGELRELPGTGPRPVPTAAEKRLFWGMALALDDERGKGGSLALALFKQKFGHWPAQGRDARRVEPDAAFRRWEQSRRIAYAKRMAKHRGAA